jgi:hypothetical protein
MFSSPSLHLLSEEVYTIPPFLSDGVRLLQSPFLTLPKLPKATFFFSFFNRSVSVFYTEGGEITKSERTVSHPIITLFYPFSSHSHENYQKN